MVVKRIEDLRMNNGEINSILFMDEIRNKKTELCNYEFANNVPKGLSKYELCEVISVLSVDDWYFSSMASRIRSLYSQDELRELLDLLKSQNYKLFLHLVTSNSSFIWYLTDEDVLEAVRNAKLTSRFVNHFYFSVDKRELLFKMLEINPERILCLLEYDVKKDPKIKQFISDNIDKIPNLLGIDLPYSLSKELKIRNFKAFPTIDNIRYIGEDLLDKEMIDLFVEYCEKNKVDRYFRNIPNKFMTKDMCYNYLMLDPVNNFGDIPSDFRSQELCKIAIEASISNFSKIDKSKVTKELCDYLMELEPVKGLKYLPGEFRTDEYCVNALINIEFNN